MRSPGVQGLGLDVGAKRPTGGGGGGVGANLLKWTEQFQNGVWTTDSAVISDADTDPLGGSTMDRVVLVADGFINQVSGTAATAGANASNGILATTSAVRYSVTGTYDSLLYTFSLWIKGLVGGEDVRLLITRTGGFLNCFVLENASEAATVSLWGAKLETGATATGTAATYGMRTT